MLAWKNFKYTHVLAADEFVSQPMVGVEVHFGKTFQPAFSLVDSGSDDILFDMDVAKEIGLDPSTYPEREIGWFAGTSRGFDEVVTLKIDKFEYAPMTEVRVTFIRGLPIAGILGSAFFDKFYVQFQQPRNLFKLALAPELT